MRTTKIRRGPVMLTAIACVALGVGVTGCGSSHTEASHTPGAAAPASSARAVATSGATGATATGDPGGGASDMVGSTPEQSTRSKLPKGVTTAKPKDPVAPSKITPVMRNGKKATPTVRVKDTHRSKSFAQPVTYTDGVSVKVTRMTQGKMTGHGPGVFPGRAVTDFHVTVTNGTKKTLPLQVVVVTVTYGSPARLAHAVYDKHSVDFSGPIKPGKSAKAVYGFSVPAAGRGHVTMAVDLDGVHQLAVFTGKVK